MSRRYKDKRKPSRPAAVSTEEEEDNFVESLQADTRSEAESTTLSSLLPVLKSSKVRATAPRVSIPDPTSDIGLTSNGAASTWSTARHKKSDDADRAKDLDEYTVETNRPIDSVYIYPTEPNTAHHRQRRHYRSGQRSVSGGDNSSRASTIGNLSAAISSGGSVGGILETLGLAGESLGGIEEESTMGSKHVKQVHSRDYYSKAKRSYVSLDSTAGPRVHMKAGLVLFLLMSMLYGAFQWIAMSKANAQLIKKRGNRGRSRARHYGAFEEGADRPMDEDLVGRISAMSPKGKVKEALEEDTSNKLVIDRAEENEKAPADKLDVIDKRKEEKETEIPVSIQTGFSGTYTKDPLHNDIPFLWYVPRSGGGMVKNILSNCKDLVVASEVGAQAAKKGMQDKIAVIEVGQHKYLNVDTTTEEGIKKAKELGLADSGLANLVISPRILEAAELFGPSKKARAFTVLRHPVERAVSMFFFLKKHKVPAVADMELEDYCKSQHVENNWMVRILSGTMTGDVDDEHLEIAKKILKEKVLVGLLEQKDETMKRFEYHFGWEYTEDPKRQEACRTRIMVGDYRANESAKGKIKEGSQAWSLLMWQNKLDMKLYKYAKALFLQQGTELFADMP